MTADGCLPTPLDPILRLFSSVVPRRESPDSDRGRHKLQHAPGPEGWQELADEYSALQFAHVTSPLIDPSQLPPAPESNARTSWRQETRVRVAIVHDWLGPMTGAERMLEQLLLCYPGADVYTAVDYLPPEHRHILGDSRVITSFVQGLPWARTKYWHYVPLMPLAFESFDLAAYDLIISHSHTAAKGIIVHPHQVHVCYLMSPMRFAWDLQSLYLRAFRCDRGIRSVGARLVLHYLRTWDAASAVRVDAFISVSSFVARRAELAYGRKSVVIHPCADVEQYAPPEAAREDFYLAASRLTPFKDIALLVEAFREMPDRRLVVIGDGPERRRLQETLPPNVTMLGYQPDAVLRDHMQRTRAFLFAAPEDFGIVMVEAQACGAPVIALGQGGATEIVRGLERPDATGVFFPERRPGSVVDAVMRFEADGASCITSASCRANALRFTPERFRRAFTEEVERVLDRPGHRD